MPGSLFEEYERHDQMRTSPEGFRLARPETLCLQTGRRMRGARTA